MIVLLKVYQTLYQNDEQKILYVLIIKSKFSNNYFKNVRFPYSDNIFVKKGEDRVKRLQAQIGKNG